MIGAGAFGGWSALELLRRGARVTLIDAWGPGHIRASSGGETRVIRATYGTRALYTSMARRAMDLWRRYESDRNVTLLHRTGALWMFTSAGSFDTASAESLTRHGVSLEELTRAEAHARHPAIDFDGVRRVLFEPDAGYLMARQACAHVVETFVAEGGVYRMAAAASPVAIDGPPGVLRLREGDPLHADAFVFACGPWLGRLFPDVVGRAIRSTRQETFYFGPPAGDLRFGEDALPVWIDYGDRLIYGVPGNAHRGFKLADDTHGEEMDPTDGDRRNTPAQIDAARAFLRRRFPALAKSPLVGGEVCQYENSPDAHFILDRHPRAANVWIVGGGSGHGFKMGPALGELVASLVMTDGTPDPAFRLTPRRLGATFWGIKNAARLAAY